MEWVRDMEVNWRRDESIYRGNLRRQDPENQSKAGVRIKTEQYFSRWVQLRDKLVCSTDIKDGSVRYLKQNTLGWH